jgi:hypothetical protein
MQQFSSLLSWSLFISQQVLGVFPHIIRSLMTAEAAAAVIKILMMCGKTPKTC